VPATPTFPGGLVTTTELPTTIDGTQPGDGSGTAPARNAQQEKANAELIALEAELGVNPSGSFTDVVTRLNGRLTVRKTADQAVTVQTLTNITDLSFLLAANIDYTFRFLLHDNGGTARGKGYGLTFGGTVTRLTARVALGGTTTTTETLGWIVASAGSVTNAALGSTGNFTSIIEGIIQVGATGGTLQVQARQGTGGTAANLNVLKGSWGELAVN
jgi:hypothetical protein